MSWTKKQIHLHLETAKRLNTVKDEAFAYIAQHRNTNERAVQEYILQRFKHYGLVMDAHRPIVAFGPSAAVPHYSPPQRGSRRLRLNTVIKIDVWARLKKPRAPYADITWMGWYGRRIPARIDHAFRSVLRARDRAVYLVQRDAKKHALPSGRAVNYVANSMLIAAGYKRHLRHSTGHSLGTRSPHGAFRHVNRKNSHPLIRRLGYTIEPGVYIDGRFGIRSEIDIMITDRWQVVVTMPMQRRWVKIPLQAH